MADLTNWDPFRRLRRQGSLWDSFFDTDISDLVNMEEGNRPPAVDIYEEDNNIVAEADMPGLDKEDIDISLDDDILTIQGSRKEEEKKEEEDCYFSERNYMSFARSIRLPSAVDESEAEASYEKGVLKVTLPKKKIEAKKQKKIDIK
ncbi:MAG: Hsp20/alpha crystallin family protein [Elusimicrobiota bacterium]